MYDYVLFDLDGTLTRSGDGIKKSAAYAIARLGYAPLSDAQLDKFVGPPLLEMFMTLCGMDEPTALKAVGFYRERFESVGWRENAVYPGIAPLLRALRAAGKYVAIATAKPEYFAVRIAEYFGMAPYLNAVTGASMADHHADKAALIARALPAGADKRRAVMVGDRKFDVLGAKAAGVHSLAVGYGYGSRDELEACAPDLFAADVSSLFSLLGVERPRGCFITFEGTDGCGKSTQMALAADWLSERGWELVRTREPGGCPISERIRQIVLSDASDADARGMTDECEALLFAASRAQHVHDVILPALRAGKIVLCDRFLDSSIVYQGYGRELGEDFIRQINKPALSARPDLTLLYEIDEREALGRATRDGHADRIEAEGAAYQRRVQSAYARLRDHEPERLRGVDATGTIEDVFARTQKALSDFLDTKE
ncbi:MAG TPA: dTMP kinase [Candidatus Pullichristensenella stercorigallinarum]|uniref:Thymidylate kinase n=1 Tax=Candidatus Pullichristensenella stercorigallinarum TaxID=2840909 RepID=A0A9D0ZLE6_9FIRM|nr:dTMP kinase [Candidatus Pullichristensenella stercorigallinarum]